MACPEQMHELASAIIPRIMKNVEESLEKLKIDAPDKMCFTISLPFFLISNILSAADASKSMDFKKATFESIYSSKASMLGIYEQLEKDIKKISEAKK